MSVPIALYTSPSAMEPLYPDDPEGKLEELATELLHASGRLSGKMNPITSAAMATFLRPMNSYYSNLIEGHDTHPIDIERVLKNDYSDNKAKRNLQEEALAHIQVHKTVSVLFDADKTATIPTTGTFLKELHKLFYDFLPEEFQTVLSREGIERKVVPGEFREDQVEVGRHIAPEAKAVLAFMKRFSEYYAPTGPDNRSKIKRIISIAASHHRLVFIHPFLDGNGRVVRLFSDAWFMYENLHASGLWSVSRGLARTNAQYKTMLANADLQRYNDYDGRGNLSNKHLVAFCAYFLETALDQINFMDRVTALDGFLARIDAFIDRLVISKTIRTEARYILKELFLKGEINKTSAMYITKLSDKTLKNIVDKLEEMGLLTVRKAGKDRMYVVAYPIRYSPMLFPGLYPADKEMDMLQQFS